MSVRGEFICALHSLSALKFLLSPGAAPIAKRKRAQPQREHITHTHARTHTQHWPSQLAPFVDDLIIVHFPLGSLKMYLVDR